MVFVGKILGESYWGYKDIKVNKSNGMLTMNQQIQEALNVLLTTVLTSVIGVVEL